MAESFAEFSQPLLDASGGSHDRMNVALQLAQLCWNLALLPEGEREESLAEMRPGLDMDDEEYDDFRRSVLLPMIQRHHEMYPDLAPHRPRTDAGPAPTARSRSEAIQHAPTRSGGARNAPCPCNSGKKYKRCCGR